MYRLVFAFKKSPEILSALWNELLYWPLYNFLIWLTSVLPGYDLGLAIIVLTIIIRGILYIPSRNSLKSQTAMQQLQPKLAKLKERYKSDPQKHAQETMKLYKQEGVHPFSSCLPLLIQFPVLIALFYVFRGVLSPDNVSHLYEPLKGFDFDKINVMFLGVLNMVEITPVSRYVMPLIVGGLQFVQMKMMTGKQDKKQLPKPSKDMPFDPAATTKMMTYFMPVMVAFFAASFPGGLSLYWSTSTGFAIVQQKLMADANKKANQSEIEVEKEVITETSLEEERKKAKKKKHNK